MSDENLILHYDPSIYPPMDPAAAVSDRLRESTSRDLQATAQCEIFQDKDTKLKG